MNELTGYLIGNGFDLQHKLKTRYCDFKAYLMRIDPETAEKIDKILEECGFLAKEIKEWSCFEEYLGEMTNMDFDYLLDEAFENSEKDMDRASYWEDPKYNIDIYTNERIKIMKKISKYWPGWINSIQVENAKVIFDLKKNDVYINFNYTKTLELLYKIPTNSILHIHQKGSKYILGHNYEKKLPYDHSRIDIMNEDTRVVMTQEHINERYSDMYEFYNKNSKVIIENNIEWFNKLARCKTICVMGLSIGKTDEVYINFISANLGNIKQIKYYWYNNNDLENYQYIHSKYFSHIDGVFIRW